MTNVIIKEATPADAQQLIAYMNIIGGETNNCGMPRRMSHRAEIGISVLKEEWNNGKFCCCIHNVAGHLSRFFHSVIKKENSYRQI